MQRQRIVAHSRRTNDIIARLPFLFGLCGVALATRCCLRCSVSDQYSIIKRHGCCTRVVRYGVSLMRGIFLLIKAAGGLVRRRLHRSLVWRFKRPRACIT